MHHAGPLVSCSVWNDASALAPTHYMETMCATACAWPADPPAQFFAAEALAGGFECKHDCWSNPADQDWVRIEPSPEWAEYGYPASVAEAMKPRQWEMEVGAVTAITAPQFSGARCPR